jgi:hypothetical protein
MKLSTALVFFVGLIAGANASCHGDCKIRCNPGNVAGYCNGECVGRCMAALCPGYVLSVKFLQIEICSSEARTDDTSSRLVNPQRAIARDLC